ncbi:hypothetical protein Nepgr_012132 [Nepenthes gracilis]|uniref:Uncharacterized protein n=1 Tax=Nepenthes gracilis TaxID=150966 RepID=A0AAD3XN08_NEPGR|nr:hypothetical protein Nepgr_012132 [Nepenthes gracilis]
MLAVSREARFLFDVGDSDFATHIYGLHSDNGTTSHRGPRRRASQALTGANSITGRVGKVDAINAATSAANGGDHRKFRSPRRVARS